MYSQCPLCKGSLKNWDNGPSFTLACEGCAYDDMSKFQATYRTDTNELIYMVWWLDDFYIKIDYETKTTVVSRIDVCILLEPFVIPRVLEIDDQDPFKTARRLKTLMIFS